MRWRLSLSSSLHALALQLACIPLVAAEGTTIWATPHESYSSSVGVLGCKINTNRVAYWPSSIDCDKLCVSLSYADRTVYLLKIDQSGGAYDVSYDAWNYLMTGHSATDQPTAGGATPMVFEDVGMEKCADLIHTDGRALPLSAANSMNFVASCLSKPDSWVAKHYRLYNTLDPICSWGRDEECTLNWEAGENQAKCPNTLGDPVPLTTAPVYNIKYPTGEKVLASSGQVVDSASDGARRGRGWMGGLGGLLTVAIALELVL